MKLLRADQGVFRFRSRERDGETDRRRFAALLASVEATRSEIVREAAHLRSRLEQASVNASFALAAMEDGGPNKATAQRTDALEQTLLRCEQRLRELARQDELLAGVANGLRSSGVLPGDAC